MASVSRFARWPADAVAPQWTHHLVSPIRPIPIPRLLQTPDLQSREEVMRQQLQPVPIVPRVPIVPKVRVVPKLPVVRVRQARVALAPGAADVLVVEEVELLPDRSSSR
jgi:hypothetical protein